MGRKAIFTELQIKAIREDRTSTIQEMADFYNTSKVTIHAVRGFKGAYKIPGTDENWDNRVLGADEKYVDKLTTPSPAPADFEPVRGHPDPDDEMKVGYAAYPSNADDGIVQKLNGGHDVEHICERVVHDMQETELDKIKSRFGNV